MMSIYLYESNKSTSGEKLKEFLIDNFPPAPVNFLSSLPELTSLPRLSLKNHSIVILLATTVSDLDRLLDIREFFEDMRVIVILPQRSPDIIAKGHLLCPRFLTFFDSNFSEVQAVLEKMLRLTCCQGQNRKGTTATNSENFKEQEIRVKSC